MWGKSAFPIGLNSKLWDQTSTLDCHFCEFPGMIFVYHHLWLSYELATYTLVDTNDQTPNHQFVLLMRCWKKAEDFTCNWTRTQLQGQCNMEKPTTFSRWWHKTANCPSQTWSVIGNESNYNGHSLDWLPQTRLHSQLVLVNQDKEECARNRRRHTTLYCLQGLAPYCTTWYRQHLDFYG